jgi:hypothetical protein
MRADPPPPCNLCHGVLGVLPDSGITLCTTCDCPDNGELPPVFERLVLDWKDGT